MFLVGSHLHHRLLYRVTKLNISKHVNGQEISVHIASELMNTANIQHHE
jgi:hypothetical protein